MTDFSNETKQISYSGLVNLGNTCFLNSCIQILNHTYELNKISSQSRHHLKNNEDASVFLEWEELKNTMFSNNCTVSPEKFVKNLHRVSKIKNKDIFTDWNQNDMSEFILFIIECIHNSISRKIEMNISGEISSDLDQVALKCSQLIKNTYEKDFSEIIDIFYGVNMSIITSNNGETIHSIIPENYFILDLPISPNKNSSIYNCMDLFVKEEFLNGENAWFNEKTGLKEDIRKYVAFWNFPNVLVITLKRFCNDGKTKINDLIDFPLENLDLSKYVINYYNTKYIYDLYAVCNHFGNIYTGHYTSFIKNIKGEWIHYNDHIVEKIENAQNVITPMAYCLFYRKK
jgi:ubiquitin C-terminal hydrolase